MWWIDYALHRERLFQTGKNPRDAERAGGREGERGGGVQNTPRASEQNVS